MIARFMSRLLGSKKESGLSEEELRTIVTMGAEEGVLNKEAANMMHNILEFKGTDVTEVMTPKIDVEMIDGNKRLDEVIDFVVKTPFSRYPVYLENKNNVVGVLDVDDVLKYIKDKEHFDVIQDAYNYALEKHEGQYRKSGDQYIIHPIDVALILSELHTDPVTIVAGLLHDVIEDTKFTVKDVKAEFGEEVAEIVDGATKIESAFENFEWNQVESYKKMLLSMTSDLRVILVKFADRLHNLRTLEYLSNPKHIRLAQETLEIYSPFAHRFGLSNVKTELEDLSFKYLNKKEYDDIYKSEKSLKKNQQESSSGDKSADEEAEESFNEE